jgi:phosphate starvation-inducible protein PhoH and related proteins
LSRKFGKTKKNQQHSQFQEHTTLNQTLNFKQVEIHPRNPSQENYLDALEDDYNSIVIATGPAGTGKSLLATLYAIEQLQKGNIDHIVICRPAVGVDEEEHGFLPGSIVDKLAPWCRPIIDVFKEYYTLKQIGNMIREEIIEFVPVAFVRGRTFKNTIVIFDEAQNSLPTAMKAVLTRIGDGSRIFVTGDMDQHDRGYAINGLRDFINKLQYKKAKYIAHIEFGIEDIERHPAVSEILYLYGD